MAYHLDNVKVLVADDMQPMLEVTSSVLETFGFKRIFTASNGEDAFKLFCDHNPELVITDWIMDPVDGLELSKMIREHPESPNKFVPIIIMTGFTAQTRVELSRDSGITEFLVKPFTAKDLYRRVFQVIEKPRQFVEADEFFGPDRRRKVLSDYEGPRRREIEGARDAPDASGKAPNQSELLKKLKEDAQNI